jgi:hypothetical protein
MGRSARQLPLELIAQAQALAAAEVQDVCFGLFNDREEGYGLAVRRLQRLVVDLMPRPPGRWLVCCSGYGSLVKALRGVGYDACCLRLAPPLLGAAPKDDNGSSARSSETLAAEAGNFNGVVFQDTSLDLDPLISFGKAHRLLNESGTVIILGEFNLQPEFEGGDDGPRLSYLASLAERCGFELREQRDLTRQASLTLDYFAHLLTEYGPRLRMNHELDRRTLAAAQQSIRDVQLRYSKGHRAYRLIKLGKRSAGRWRVSHAETCDFPALAELFHRVFQEKMSEKLWSWKYGEGRGQASIVWRDGTVVAHYGGVSRPILFFGKPASACQIADVMVEPSERGALTRRGPFFQAAASFAEVYLGYGSKHVLGFGFPNARVMKLACKLSLYDDVGEMTEMAWKPDHRGPVKTLSLQPLMEMGQARLDRLVYPLWDAMRRDLRHAIVGVRDSAWLRYRYFSHPRFNYETLLVARRWRGKPLGVMVLRCQGTRCELLDVIAPLSRVPLVVREARRYVAQRAVDELYCWISEGFSSLFDCCEGERRILEINVPTSQWVIGPSPAKLEQRWWLMGGDTDFH